MRTMRNLIILCLFPLTVLALVALWPGRAEAESPRDILVIAHPSFSGASVSTDEVRDFFLKKRKGIGGQGNAIPINALNGTSLRADFQARVLGRTAVEEQGYWQDRKIKTGDTPPTEFKNTLKAVFKLRGSVSYIYRSEYHEGLVKVLLVLPAK